MLDWCNSYVVPRLVDELLGEVRATGVVRIGELSFSRAGIDTATERLPWPDFIDAEFAERGVLVRSKRITTTGFVVFARADTFTPGAPLIPDLCRRLRSLAHA